MPLASHPLQLKDLQFIIKLNEVICIKSITVLSHTLINYIPLKKILIVQKRYKVSPVRNLIRKVFMPHLDKSFFVLIEIRIISALLTTNSVCHYLTLSIYIDDPMH